MFNPLNVSSKFAICGLPIRMDTYKYCTFGCKYCFSNNREIMKFNKKIEVANVAWLERTLKRVLVDKYIKKQNFLDTLIASDITFHCGGMSDPFQPCEEQKKITQQSIDICNNYKRSILFSTKSNTVYGSNIRPDLHSFQISITGADKTIEPYAPTNDERYEFFSYLKKEGFKVGIRIQPFIPNVTTLDIVKRFKNADNFTLEGLKVVPQNKEMKDFVYSQLKISPNDFTQMGLLNLKPNIRLDLYKPFIDYFLNNGIHFSIADNDLHYLGDNLCCCGDALIKKSTNFNSTYLSKMYTKNYTKENLDTELCASGCKDCICNQLFTSNRQEGCTTVQDFFDKRFNRKTSPFSPKFLI